MIAIIKWELWRRRSFILWWGAGIIFLIALTVLTYGTVADKADELNRAFGDLSRDIGSFIGTSDMFSPAGYLNSQLYFITLPILFIILGVVLVKSLMGKEEDSGTLELVLSRPVSRQTVLIAKALSAFIVLTFIGTVTAAAIIACAAIAGMEISLYNILLTTCITTYFSGAFSAIAFTCLAASKATRGLALVAAVLLGFGSYIITSLSDMVQWLEPVSKALPYHYYNPSDLLAGNVSTGLIVYLLIIYVSAFLVSVKGFDKRDIV